MSKEMPKEMPKEGKSNRYSTPGFTVIFVVIAIVLICVWMFMFIKVNKMSKLFVEERTLLASENSKEAYVSLVTKDLRETQAEREYLNTLFIFDGAEASFLERIEELGRSAQVKAKVLTFDTKDSTLNLIVSATGKFSEIYYFVGLLEAVPLSLRVNNANFKQVGGEKGVLNWEGTFDLTLSGYLPKK